MTSRISHRAIDATGYVGDGNQALHDDGTWKIPAGGGGSGAVETIVAGAGIAVDSTDPANPVVSATGGGGAANQDTTVTRSVSAQALSSGVWTDVIFDTEENDPLGAWSSGASVVVPTGITRARIFAAVAWSNTASGNRYLRVYNATTDATYGGDIRASVNEALATVTTPWVPVVAGQSLRLRALSSVAASVQGTGFGGPTRMTVEWA